MNKNSIDMENNKLKLVDIIFDTEACDTGAILDKVLKRTPEDIINEMIDSGLRGRGGAGFPTGLKWKFTRSEDSFDKYIICNADEGEPGTFKDREILERVPNKVFTGMAIAGYAIGAKEGFIYIRGEYRFLRKQLTAQIAEFNQILKNKGLDFTIDIRWRRICVI
jgi:[NiFe] hydrogenase diaphorase moiety large subunit